MTWIQPRIERTCWNRYLCIWSATVGTGDSRGRNSNKYKRPKAHKCKKSHKYQMQSIQVKKFPQSSHKIQIHTFGWCALGSPPQRLQSSYHNWSQSSQLSSSQFAAQLQSHLLSSNLIVILMLTMMMTIAHCACHTRAANTSKNGWSTNN